MMTQADGNLLLRVTALLAALFFAQTSAVAQDRIDFVESVRPILTRHCSRCHGDKQNEGGLRLSSRTQAFSPADSDTPVIVPGHPDKSLLIRRVISDAEGEQMPADSEPLSPHEIDVLRRWIAQGASWPEGADGHWAYRAPVRPTPPDVPVATHGNVLDRFINQRLAKPGLEPNPRAERARLLRRASLTLTGLPPSIEQLDEFLADTDAGAWERAVDRLLASRHYGERWAQHWLDLARYADSNGFQADQLREIWAYRDWVIKALNNEMPFDQFTIEQLAGDLLPNATLEQRIATGFHRTVPCNVEAGVHPEENRHNQVFDRVNTTGTVFLGTTIECAQCHDHKYDPFTQEDYYRLFAFFNNTPLEVKLNSGVQYELEGPKMELPLPAEKARQRSDLQDKIRSLEQELEMASGSAADRAAWEQSIRAALVAGVKWSPLRPSSVHATANEDLTVLDDGSVLVSGEVPPNSTSYTIESRGPVRRITAIRLDALTDPSLPGSGPGRGDPVRTNFILSELSVSVRRGKRIEQVALHSPHADFSQKGWSVAAAIDGDPKTGWAIAPQFSRPHHATFAFETAITLADDDQLIVRMDQNYGRGRTLGRVRVSVFDGEPAAIGVAGRLANAFRRQAGKRSAAQQKLIDTHFADADPKRNRLSLEIGRLRTQLESINPPTTLVMVEMQKPRETHLLNRGNYLSPGRRVDPGPPGTLHPFESSQYESNRLGLARWLVSPENPLLSRVVVNRWWNEIFGRGLVSTVEDFGTQSEPPTHPALLDWLAVEFIESGWSMKHMHKLMVMSAAFQRSSRVSSEQLSVDPANAWYSRGPRFRLSAETVRDNALAVSGLLSTKMFGPPVMPYQPAGIWRAVGRNAPKWVSARDENRFRRGVYVVWRRAAPYPSFVNFDAPDRAACVVSRPRTNTPLQALTLLNDPAYLEMALSLASRMRTAAETDASRVNHGFRLCVARQPDATEQAVLLRVLAKERDRIGGNPEIAKRLFASVPGYQPPRDNAAELAAWFAVANVLLNLDETITNG